MLFLMFSRVDPRTFRFMDLPMEIRIMVYESFMIEIRRRTLRYLLHRDKPFKAELTLVTKGIPGLPILVVSRQIHAEAREILETKVAAIRHEPVRLIVDHQHMFTAGVKGVLLCLAFAGKACVETVNAHVFGGHEAITSHAELHRILNSSTLNLAPRQGAHVILAVQNQMRRDDFLTIGEAYQCCQLMGYIGRFPSLSKNARGIKLTFGGRFDP